MSRTIRYLRVSGGVENRLSSRDRGCGIGRGGIAEGRRRAENASAGDGRVVFSALGCDSRQASRAGGWRRSWPRAADRLWRGRAGGYVMQSIGIAAAMR